MNFIVAPTDKDGFCVTFDVANREGIREFFHKYGFVCIADVFSTAEIDDTNKEFFSQFDPNNDASVESFFDSQPFSKFGVMGNEPDISSISMLRNRQSEKVYDSFCAIFNRKDLIVDHDRFGALRPTVNHESWKTIDRWLHLDCNPVTGGVAVESFSGGTALHDWNLTFLVQGFIALTDARKENGGFQCVPGGHRYAKEWTKKDGRIGSTLVVNQNDPIREFIQKIAVRSGTLVVWNSFLFHANHPNLSDQWRLVQYIRMYPVNITPFQPLQPYITSYPPEFNMTALGRNLFGIDQWAE